jgi:flagellar assembly factor FliW
LYCPVVLFCKAKEPKAVFLIPVVLANNAKLPTAVLLAPVVFNLRD